MEDHGRTAIPWKRLIRYLAIATVQVSLLIGAALLVEDYRGERAWARYKSELATLGITVPSLLALVVSEEENFAKTAIFAQKDRNAKAALVHRLQLHPKERDAMWPDFIPWRLGQKLNQRDWADYLGTPKLRDALKYPELRDIALAASRPYALFQERFGDDCEIETDHLGILFNLSTLYQLRSLVSLSEGIPDRAADDLITLLRLARHAEATPLLLSALTEASILNLAMQPLWEGMITHQWPESLLQTLQTHFEAFDLIATWPRIVQGEQLLEIRAAEQLAANRYRRDGAIPAVYQRGRTWAEMAPAGWIYRNAIASRSYFETLLLMPVQPMNQTVSPQLADAIELRATQIRSRHPYRYLVPKLIPPFASTLEKLTHAQATLRQAALACALERYWLRHRRYPESLRALIPRYIAAFPIDPITGGPMRYARTEDDGYRLYSVGWNTIDDGGRVAIRASDQIRHDSRDGDWVWRVPGGEASPSVENSGLVQTKRGGN